MSLETPRETMANQCRSTAGQPGCRSSAVGLLLAVSITLGVAAARVRVVAGEATEPPRKPETEPRFVLQIA